MTRKHEQMYLEFNQQNKNSTQTKKNHRKKTKQNKTILTHTQTKKK